MKITLGIMSAIAWIMIALNTLFLFLFKFDNTSNPILEYIWTHEQSSQLVKITQTIGLMVSILIDVMPFTILGAIMLLIIKLINIKGNK